MASGLGQSQMVFNVAETANRGGLVGERKFATVLFVDIVDSSSLVASVDPELADDRLVPILSLLCEVVVRFGGTVAQIMGDGVLAVFGAPAALEDHAQRACLAASEIQQSVKGLPTEVAVRVGISSGEIVLQPGVGEELRCVGESTYTAARAQERADPGEIVATAATRDLLGGGVDATSKGFVRLGDRHAPVEIFVLAAVTRLVAAKDAARHGRTPFVGREEQLSALEKGAESAIRGRGRTLLVHGEAGIGKTRLTSKFLDGLDTDRIKGCCIALAPKALQSPFEALLRLLNHCLAGRKEWTSIEAMPGFPGHSDLDPALRLKRTADWACETILAVAEIQPLVIVVEDVDRLDSVTALTLRELARRGREAALLLVLTLRTGTADLDEFQHDQRVELYPLAQGDSRRLAMQLLARGERVPSMRVAKALCAKARGNPYFLEECAMVAGDSVPPPRAAEGVFQPPGSIHALLSERIDNLPPGARAVLLLMSVVGETVDVNVLERVSDQSSEQLLRSLTTLLSAGFIFQLRILPRVEFSFHHSLVRDVAYRTLLRKVRLELHGAVYDAIAELIGGQASSQLAYHAVYAERWRDGYLNAMRAAREAKRFSRNEEARALLSLGEECLDALPADEKTDRRRVDLLQSLAAVLFVMGRHREARSKLADGLRTARRLNDKARGIAVLSGIGLSQWGDGQLGRACASVGLVRRIARRENMRGPWIRASVRLGMLLANRGDFRRAAPVLHEVADEIPESEEFVHFGLLGSAASGARAALSAAYSELGDFTTAGHCGAQALDIATRSGHPFSQIYANTYVANGLLVQGAYERAMKLLEETLALCDGTGSDVLYPQAAAMLANTWARAGRSREDIKDLYDRVAALDAEGLRSRRPVGAHWMAEAFALTGDDTKAVELADAALAVSRAGAELGDVAWALRLRGGIESRRGGWRAALEFLDEGAAVARRCGMAPVEQACRSDMAWIRSTQNISGQVLNRLGR